MIGHWLLGDNVRMDLSKIVTIMNQVYGRDLSVFNTDFLEKSFKRRSKETGIADFAEYGCYIKNNSMEADALYRSLYINFSQFFRDPMTYALLEKRIFPCILAGRPEGSEIRIWSAGCADGQEAYSLGILLAEIIEESGKEYRYRIFATDISSEALEAGESGEFDLHGVQEVKLKYLTKYFVRQGEKYKVIPSLKQHINFSRYDLLDQNTANPPESIYGDFDMVICSNLLIYYTEDRQKIMINKLFDAAAANGYLVTGDTEKSLFRNEIKINKVSTPTAIFRKYK